MRRLRPLLSFVVVFPFLLASTPSVFAQDKEQGAQSPYPVEPIYPPDLTRPAIEPAAEALPDGTTGRLPEYDGGPFRLNLAGAPDTSASVDAAANLLEGILGALSLTFDAADLRPVESTVAQPQADKAATEQQIREGEAETRRRLSGRFGELNEATEQLIEDQVDEARRILQRRQEVFRYQQ
jgi:hypothetical protein